jgi:hypothetical protein
LRVFAADVLGDRSSDLSGEGAVVRAGDRGEVVTDVGFDVRVQLHPAAGRRLPSHEEILSESDDSLGFAYSHVAVSSRLVRDGYGRLVVEVTVPRRADETAGDTYHVLGNNFESGGLGVGFLEERTGRPPRRARVFPPYYPARARELKAEGRTVAEIADELAVNSSTVKFWVFTQPRLEREAQARAASVQLPA